MVSDKEFKQLHETEMEILDEIDNFCKKHNIKYFLCGGSAIGAIRHQGFIPWDDDIDIGMLREDYDRFIKEYKDNDKFYVQCYEKDKNYWNLFMKVRKKNTYMNEKRLEHLDVPKEIFVDIFPFDNAPVGGYGKIKLRANLMKLLKSALLLKKKVKTLSECNAKPLNLLFSFLPARFIMFLADRTMKRDKKLDTSYCVSYLSEYPIKREYFLKDVFVPVKKMKFENRKYNVPNDIDEYLSSLFGDYMKLPDESERINHGVLEVSFDTSKR